MDEWHTITYNNKSAGKLRLETHWTPTGGAQGNTQTAQQSPYIPNP